MAFIFTIVAPGKTIRLIELSLHHCRTHSNGRLSTINQMGQIVLTIK